MIPDAAIMFDHCGGVQNTVFSDVSCRINDNPRHNDRSAPDSGRIRHDRGWMNDGRGLQSSVESIAKTVRSNLVIPNRDQKSGVSASRGETDGWSIKLTSAKSTAPQSRGIIDKGNVTKKPGSLRDIQNDLPVSARAPQDEFGYKRPFAVHQESYACSEVRAESWSPRNSGIGRPSRS
ncbi:MAG TPA: hypothetical protein VGM43_16400, partial [Bryobacteraceae bacterium]